MSTRFTVCQLGAVPENNIGALKMQTILIVLFSNIVIFLIASHMVIALPTIATVIGVALSLSLRR